MPETAIPEEISVTENQAFQQRVAALFPRENIVEATLSTPAGLRPNQPVFWLAGLGMWAYFPPEPLQGTRWGLWFGKIANPPNGNALTPSLEVNLRADPQSNAAGRALRADDNQYLLAHTGKLGGNAQGATIEAFTQAIAENYNVNPMEFTSINGDTKKAFLVGDLSSPDFIQQVARYVEIVWQIRQGF